MILVSTYAMIPLAVLLVASLKVRSVGLHSAAETATAGLVTLIPEGLVLLMSVTFAVAAVRLARKRHADPADERLREPRLGRHDLRRQDRHADRGRAEAAGVEFADNVDPAVGAAVLGRFAASAGNRNGTLEAIADATPATRDR